MCVPGELDVVLGEAREGDLHDGEVAQQLLDGAVHDRRVGGDAAVVVGVVEQHGGAEREHAGAGLEAAGEHAVGEAAEVEVVDLVAVLADDLADQALAGVLALLAGRLHQEPPRVRHGTEGPLTAVRHVEAGRAELTEGLAVLVGQAEQLADHQERHGEREGAGPGRRPARTASRRSSWRSTIAAMRGRSRSRRRIVNSGVSSLRSRVCSGGSVKPRPPMSPSAAAAPCRRTAGCRCCSSWCPRAPRGPPARP